MIAKLCPCQHSADLARLVTWATEHLFLLLWLPPAHCCRNHVPNIIKTSAEKKPDALQSSSPTREAWEMESSQYREHTGHRGQAPPCFPSSFPYSCGLCGERDRSWGVLRLGPLISWQGFLLEYLLPISTRPHPSSHPSSTETNCPISVWPSVPFLGSEWVLELFPCQLFFSSRFLDYFSTCEAFHNCSLAKAGKCD